MKEIKLRKSDKVALVDDEDYEYLSQFRWYCTHERHCYYAVSFKHINGYSVPLRMHRLILNAPRGTMIDHIDHNGLNNQKNNLRFVNYIQNGQNRQPNKGYKYKGVNSFNGKYEAKIQYNNKKIYLGTFETEEEAALAYNDAALKYFGEYAHLNIIKTLPFMYKMMSLV
jgi:hypothetical protein